MSHLKQQNNFEEKLKEQLDGMEWKPSNSLWDRIEQNMDADSFEPALQNKLANYSLEPHAEVWENVEAQLPEKDNRKGFLWLSVISFVLLASFGAGYWFREVEVENKVAVNAAGQSNTFQQAQTTKEVSVRTDKKAQQKNSDNKANRPKGLRLQSSKTNALNKPNRVFLQTESTGLTPTVIVNHSATNQVKNTKKRKQAISTLIAANLPIANQHANLLDPIALILDAANGRSSQEKSQATLIPENDQHKAALQDLPTGAVPAPKVTEIPSMPPLEANVNDTFAENKPFRGSSYIAPEDNFTNFSLSAFAGLNNAYMQLSMPGTSNITNLKNSYDLRKNMESAGIDFSGGLLIDYHFAKSWFVSAGIGMTNLKQDISFNTQTAQQSNPNLVQPINLYVHSGDTIIAGKGNSYENKFSFTEIPLYLTYQIPSEGDFNFSIMGGVSYAHLNLVNAYMPDPACIGILVVTDKESFPKFKDVVFFNFAPAASYKINSSVELGSMLQAKMSLNNMVGEAQWVQQRPLVIGLNLFVRKRF